jgi:predicted RNA-binding protein with PUA-like domain
MSTSFERTAAAVTAIYALESHDELRDIYDAIRNKEKQLSRANIRQITKGDVVSFTARNGHRVVGVVAKVNIKTVIVKVGDLNSVFATQYKVPASMLKVEEAV